MPPDKSLPSAPHPRPTILLVEDEQDMADEILAALRSENYTVTHAVTGTQGLALMRSTPTDLLIADRTLPELDGLSLIETIRKENIRVPVLVLSALASVDERIKGLKAGGDDYLTKPFAMAELFARVEALLRRPSDTRQTFLIVSGLKIDLINRQVWRNGREVELSPREFKLLEYMMRRPGQVVTRAMLFEDVWNYNFVPQTNLVDVHMGRLRHKIDGPQDVPMIQAVPRIGFILNETA